MKFFVAFPKGTTAVLLAIISVSAWSRIALAREERKGVCISSRCSCESALNEKAEPVKGMRRLWSWEEIVGELTSVGRDLAADEGPCGLDVYIRPDSKPHRVSS